MDPRNARRGFDKRKRDRELSRRQQATAWQSETFPQKEGKMFTNDNPNRTRNFGLSGCGCLLVLAAIVLLAWLIFWNPFGFHLIYGPQPVASTQAPVATLAPTAQIPFAQAETCPSIVGPTDTTKYVEFDLAPNTTVAGDFEALINGKWVILHDNGIGQYEIYRNVGTEVVKMRGHWGGGCLLTVDVKTLVNGEFQNPNHTDFVRAHLVTFTSANAYTEVMYSKSELPLK